MNKGATIKFILANWLGILGLIIGIAGSLFGIFSYVNRFAEAIPAFIEQSPRTKIISRNIISTMPLRVVRADGAPVEGDITAATFYFWNRGDLAIKKENILVPLTLNLEEKESEILDLRILKSTREVVQPTLELISGSENKTVRLSFEIMEEGDGFSFQIIFRGNPNANVSLKGAVEGVKYFATAKTLRNRQLIPEIWKTLKWILIIISIFFLVSLMGKVGEWIGKKVKLNQGTTKIVQRIKGILGLILALSFLAMFVTLPITCTLENAQKNTADLIPPEIK